MLHEKREDRPKRGFRIQFLLIGLAITPVAVLYVLHATAAGHGSYVGAILLYPYTMLIAYCELLPHDIFYLVLLCMQLPLEGFILDRGVQAGRFRAVGLAVVISHAAAVAICFTLE